MSGIIVSKAVQGFIAANARPSCRNCKHVNQRVAERNPPFDTVSWFCKKGGFYTSALAICNQHDPMRPGAAT